MTSSVLLNNLDLPHPVTSVLPAVVAGGH